jgi:hypothetical protein
VSDRILPWRAGRRSDPGHIPELPAGAGLYTAGFTVFSCFQGPAIFRAIQQLDPCDRSITSGLPFSRQSEPIIRHGDWKLVLEEQREERMKVWSEPLVSLRLPLIFNLRRDPFERRHNSNSYTSSSSTTYF